MDISTILYGIPLTACIALVYCATRYEQPEKILRSAVSFFLKTVAGLSLLYAILWVSSN
jgi:hypothetical protein